MGPRAVPSDGVDTGPRAVPSDAVELSVENEQVMHAVYLVESGELVRSIHRSVIGLSILGLSYVRSKPRWIDGRAVCPTPAADSDELWLLEEGAPVARDG